MDECTTPSSRPRSRAAGCRAHDPPVPRPVPSAERHSPPGAPRDSRPGFSGSSRSRSAVPPDSGAGREPTHLLRRQPPRAAGRVEFASPRYRTSPSVPLRLFHAPLGSPRPPVAETLPRSGEASPAALPRVRAPEHPGRSEPPPSGGVVRRRRPAGRRRRLRLPVLLNDDGSYGARIVEAEHAVRWGAAYWPAGAVQEWVLADDPDWTDSWVDPDGEAQPSPFSSHTAAAPFVREAMAAWSRIPTADIRWRLTGVASGPGIGQDGRNAITVNADLYGAGRAQRWHRRADSGRPWEVFECVWYRLLHFSSPGSQWSGDF